MKRILSASIVIVTFATMIFEPISVNASCLSGWARYDPSCPDPNEKPEKKEPATRGSFLSIRLETIFFGEFEKFRQYKIEDWNSRDRHYLSTDYDFYFLMASYIASQNNICGADVPGGAKLYRITRRLEGSSSSELSEDIYIPNAFEGKLDAAIQKFNKNNEDMFGTRVITSEARRDIDRILEFHGCKSDINANLLENIRSYGARMASFPYYR